MRLLFVGSIFNQHLYNFSRTIHSLGVIIYGFNLSDVNKNTIDKNECPYEKVWEKGSYFKLRVIDVIFKLVGSVVKFMSIKERIDIVQIHYIDVYYSIPFVIISKIKKRKVSCFVYGSDFLRVGKFKRRFLKIVFYLADSIVCDSTTLCLKLQSFIPNMKAKVSMVNFGSIIIDELISKQEGSRITRKDKIRVMCGYNGRREQNHINIIKALSNYNNRLFLILPMTYGGDNDYMQEVKKILNEYNFEYIIYDTFLPNDKWESILLSSDLFIHMQVSDAFSTTLAEHLLLGHVVINADWLVYDDLVVNDIYYLKSNFQNLSFNIAHILDDYEVEKKRHEKNRNKIAKLKSLNYCCKNYWLPYYESLLGI